MNENKMMSYEMYEELKSSILKTIKTEIANVKPTAAPPVFCNRLNRWLQMDLLNMRQRREG